MTDSTCCPKAERIQFIVADQAEDEELWFMAENTVELHLQLELRRLHKAIEHEFGQHND